MIYTVGWKQTALNALADLYLNATDKQAVTAASNRIDQELRRDAHKKGQAFNDERLLRVPPLAVVFVVDPGDCKVTVLQVGRIA
jgi:hypothetical protein